MRSSVGNYRPGTNWTSTSHPLPIIPHPSNHLTYSSPLKQAGLVLLCCWKHRTHTQRQALLVQVVSSRLHGDVQQAEASNTSLVLAYVVGNSDYVAPKMDWDGTNKVAGPASSVAQASLIAGDAKSQLKDTQTQGNSGAGTGTSVSPLMCSS